jgi:hypothetical protein
MDRRDLRSFKAWKNGPAFVLKIISNLVFAFGRIYAKVYIFQLRMGGVAHSDWK